MGNRLGLHLFWYVPKFCLAAGSYSSDSPNRELPDLSQPNIVTDLRGHPVALLKADTCDLVFIDFCHRANRPAISHGSAEHRGSGGAQVQGVPLHRHAQQRPNRGDEQDPRPRCHRQGRRPSQVRICDMCHFQCVTCMLFSFPAFKE